MLENIFKSLGANARVTIGVSVSPGLGLEMIEIDRSTNVVNKYGFKPLEYNYSTREVADYTQFQLALGELFDDLRIPRKSNIILNIPNVHFGTISLPLLLTDESITNAIISEVEQSYIFKRHEPVVSWIESGSNIETESRSIVYTAIQESALKAYKDACSEIGCNISAIETSYASFFKALQYTDIARDQLKENVTWNLMVISQNHYSIFSMVGKKVVEYYEEPLALKSFVGDEIYNAITTSAQLTLAGLPANYLFIASETDLVSSEVLSLKIHFEGQIKFLESNKYAQLELMPVNLNVLPNIAARITPEAIGAGIYTYSDFPIKFNLTGEKDISYAETPDLGTVPRINIGNTEVELTPEFTKKLVAIIGGAIFVPLLLIALTFGGINSAQQAKLDEITQKLNAVNEEIKQYNGEGGGAFDINQSIEKISAQDRTELLYFSALRFSVPEKLWITYYMTNADKKVDIKGRASDAESVYAFYKNLKQMVINSDIKLYKFEIVTDSVDEVVQNISDGPRYFEFEITNMTAEELNPPKKEGEQAKEGENKSGFNFFKKPSDTTGNASAPPPAAPAPAPAPTPATDGGSELPKNLQSIEKF